ncbi:RNase adapter RapZ [Luteococcus peritonei]|uniref:RNase adapter RapZ n=1 Tax=Luteococcus peritonei TaxID=88874 RepID=A0ABW4RQY7_9ACTN
MSTPTSSAQSPSSAGPRVVIITGLSGAGRRTAAHQMEDLGWYVVDNLPPSMLPGLVDLARRNDIAKLGVVLDVRSRALFEQLGVVFADLAEQGVEVEVLYLEADDAVIVRRQESTRRPLPLQGDGRLVDGITKERAMLSSLRAAADLVIDTTNLNVHQLSARVAHAYGGDDGERIRVVVMSFGFKNGLPLDADLVLDVRFLPNPHWVPELRPQTGLSEAVSSYVLGQNGATDFLDKLQGLFQTMAPGYVREGKRQVTVAIGCTGGKHRSTAMSEEFGRRLREQGMQVSVMHRDLGKE